MPSFDGDDSELTLLPTLVERTGDELKPGSRAGSYTIVENIGRGGCGTVYLATHDGDGRRAAVKVLHWYLAADPQGVERFLREVRAVDRIRHPSIVEIYDLGYLLDDRPYFAMELLDGTNLRRLLQVQGRLSPNEAHEILEHVCGALSAAHAAGIIHRDVKAENVVVCSDRRVKLLDFGVAKLIEPDPTQPGLTTTQQVIGTLVAMAPEQIRCQPVDQRTDVYGVGVLAYNILTGIYPFRGPPEDVARMHLESPPRPPSAVANVSPTLDAVVLRCLEKDPAARYPTVSAVLDAFRTAVFGSEMPTHPRPAIGILFRARAAEGSDDEDALAEAVMALDSAESELTAAGFSICLQTSSEILGIRLAPTSPEDELAARRAAVELAQRLHSSTGAGAHVAVTVHANDVLVREGSTDITGGPLVEIGNWAFPHEGVAVTPKAGSGLPPV